MNAPGGSLGQPAARRRAGRIALRLGVAALVLIGLLLIALLIQATNNQRLYERYYAPLYAVNFALASTLALVIAWGIYRLARRLRSGKFGSRLLVKLAAVFGLVGIAPGLLIYGVSFQFVSRSIESWFDVRVEGALNSGLDLARASLEAQAREFGSQLRTAASALSQTPDAAAGVPLERLRQQLGATDVLLWSASGRLIASAGSSRFTLSPERPSAQILRSVRQNGVATQLEGLDEAADAAAPRVQALALVGGRGLGLLEEQRVLQAVQPLPADLVAHALAVQQANREYQERALGRVGLRRMYIGTLTLSLALAVFGAVLLAVLLGKQIATPLLTLAEGVRQVAAGDLTPKTVLPGRDEMASLTRSFADMTQQLAGARAALDESMHETESARANLQTILDNLTAGVIVLGPGCQIVSANPGATRILRAPLAACLGQNLGTLPCIESFAQGVAEQFADLEGTHAERGLDHWQRTFELYASEGASGHSSLTLVARGALLPDGRRLLVFDDISEIVSAQRARAWGEVARRLAHEIKNPLTPIQLSAERLERRLVGKLAGDADRAVLAKSVKTITDQVDAMKRLVNEFREYARLPSADLKPLDLNALVEEVLLLYGHNHDHGGHQQEGGAAALPVRAELDRACPQVHADAAQLRQVIHNLVQNALDASAPGGNATQERGPVTVHTQWHAATGRVRLSVLDQGHGFPEEILARAFEPYVTTKAKGTGLGLPMVKKIAEDHGARIDIANRVQDGRVIGARVSLSFEPAKPATTISNA
ncbi:MAG: HAMP domain-containing protein [Burkholderiaceae bacterium]|nr:HAMP domain-containing protein [Burkholderiaceae bacterium]